MITKIALENFKSFSEPITADVNDLTVIAGPNSCGKSSIIQLLLLLAQTLENPHPEVAIDLGGRFVQFAEFREATFGRPKNKDAEFSVGFTLDVQEEDLQDINVLFQRQRMNRGINSNINNTTELVTNKAYISITFRVNRQGTPYISFCSYQKTVQKVGDYKCELQWVSKNSYKMLYEFIPSTSYKKDPSEVIGSYINRLREEIEKENKIRESRALSTDRNTHELAVLYRLGEPKTSIDEAVETIFRYFYRTQIQSRAKQTIEDNKNDLDELQRLILGTPITKSAIVHPQFEHFLLGSNRYMSLGSKDEGYLFEKFYENFRSIVTEVRTFLKRLHYIGPLRARPERAYLSTGTPIEIGNAGENAVPILWVNQNVKVTNKTHIGGKSREQNLEEAVRDWLGEFGIASAFHITKPKRVIYQAEMESSLGSNIMVTIADVGFGVSQVLPVIVAGLWAKKDSTLILEQPEIHLHPRLQGKLADFLICLAELDKRIIVETHSEHLINMLRLRIIQDKSGLLQKRIGILFVRSSDQVQTKKQGNEHKGSYIENLKVDEYGKISNWPPDFFPESSQINEAILRAMLEKSTQGSNK